jgi:transposase
MKKAFEAVEAGESIRRVSKRMGISFETLKRHSSRKKTDATYVLGEFSQTRATRKVFSVKEEKELGQYLLRCSRSGFPLDTHTIRKLAFQLAERNGKKYPDKWTESQGAGEDWMTSFSQRHKEISLHVPEATSLHVLQRKVICIFLTQRAPVSPTVMVSVTDDLCMNACLL